MGRESEGESAECEGEGGDCGGGAEEEGVCPVGGVKGGIRRITASYFERSRWEGNWARKPTLRG